MQKILFKGKRLDNGEWVQGGSIIQLTRKDGVFLVYIAKSGEKTVAFKDEDENIVAVESGKYYKIDPETLCQWTGKKDKNGVEVFDGDLLKGTCGIMRVFYGPITGHGYGFQWENLDGFEESMTGFIDEYEVIGNIHCYHECLEAGLTPEQIHDIRNLIQSITA